MLSSDNEQEAHLVFSLEHQLLVTAPYIMSSRATSKFTKTTTQQDKKVVIQALHFLNETMFKKSDFILLFMNVDVMNDGVTAAD